jgi:predicted dehydrogenase
MAIFGNLTRCNARRLRAPPRRQYRLDSVFVKNGMRGACARPRRQHRLDSVCEKWNALRLRAPGAARRRSAFHFHALPLHHIFMRFAVAGDHADGLQMALALTATGRYEAGAYTGPQAGAQVLAEHGVSVRAIRDFEEVLADPAIDLVIVGGKAANRAQQLRRALQAERHVLCVYPPDCTPDIAYEAAMIRQDTAKVLLPLMPESLHPEVMRLATTLRGAGGPGETWLIDVRRLGRGSVLIHEESPGWKACVPGWDTLRSLGGEVAELSALAPEEELRADQPATLTGRFENGWLFQLALMPGSPANLVTINARASDQQVTVTLDGEEQGSSLTLRASVPHQPDAWNPWPAMVEVFEQALARPRRPGQVTWQTAVRSLELDDAARRSVQRRRVSSLEYPEANEEVGFKGTMTLLGCSLLWISLLLLILSRWLSWLGWLVVPLIGLFLGLQLLRWVVPAKRMPEDAEDEGGTSP